MAIAYERFREQVSPSPSPNSVKLGVLSKIHKVTKAETIISTIYGGGSPLPASILRTWDQVNKRVRLGSGRLRRKFTGWINLDSYQYIWLPVTQRVKINGKWTRQPVFFMLNGVPQQHFRRVKKFDRIPTYKWVGREYARSAGDKGYRNGGPFLSSHVRIPDNSVKGQGTYFGREDVSFDSNYVYKYQGGFADPLYSTSDMVSVAEYLSIGANSTPSTWLPDLSSYGAKAYARLRPQLEQAGLAVFLSESRDLPGMLKTTAKNFHELWKLSGGSQTSKIMHPKSVADNWLNHHFGWVPFVGDLVKFYDVYQNSEKYVDQISRDNNTWIKRVRTIEHTESEQLITQGGTTWGLTPSMSGLPWDVFCNKQTVPGGTKQNGQYQIYEIKKTRIWGMGSFKYYRPEFDRNLSDYSSQYKAAQRQLLLYGLRISPTNVYKATPWTWLIDWFSNVGDHISLVQDIAMDGITSRYFYVMRHSYRQLAFRATLYYWKSTLALEWLRTIETKQRRHGLSPYGFNLQSSFTAKQISILSALGLSKYF